MTKERFESKFDKTEGCWIWNAATGTAGYGAFFYNGKRATASRVSYILYRGDIPDGLHVLHKCDTPACVNPEHLFLGTNRDNVEDRKSKGRRVGRLKVLSEEQVQQVRDLLTSGLHSYRAINRMTGFSRETIRRIAINTY